MSNIKVTILPETIIYVYLILQVIICQLHCSNPFMCASKEAKPGFEDRAAYFVQAFTTIELDSNLSLANNM